MGARATRRAKSGPLAIVIANNCPPVVRMPLPLLLYYEQLGGCAQHESEGLIHAQSVQRGEA